jgi:uncharacterized protein
MDVLRGIAVFGIFLINMPLFVAPPDAFFDWRDNVLWTGAADRLVTMLLAIFVQAKFYTLFSFLFGLGFGVQMTRAAERQSPDFVRTYRRRALILLAIGLLHFLLIWWGDVLHLYALLGLLLLALRNKPDRFLLRACLIATVVPLAIMLVGRTVELSSPGAAAPREARIQARNQERKNRAQNDIAVYSRGPAVEILRYRAQRNVQRLPSELAWSIELFISFLLGLWASRRDIFRQPQQYRWLLRPLLYVALPVGLLISTVDSVFDYLHPNQPTPLWATNLETLKEFVGRPAMAFGYAAGLLLSGTARWMMPFAAVGRMALTNYLLQSVVFTTVANSYGLGLYGRIPPVTQVLLCFGFYALQMAASVWWLQTHAYGPMEWVWRSLTYGARQPWLISERPMRPALE